MKPGTRTVLRTAAWSTSALILMAAAAGTASAVTSHKSHAAASSSDSTDNSARPHLLHDLATVENSDGTFDQYATQIGKVSAVSASSITVVSDDKYSATYAVDNGTHVMKNGSKATIGDVATGDTVLVRAEDEDGSFTAQVVGDGKPPAGRGPGGHRPPPPGAPGGPGPDEGAPGPGGPGAPGGAGDGT
jgi:hypothetical protein